MYIFLLWREYKLSIAEISSVFLNSKIKYCFDTFLVLDWIDQDEIIKKANRLWWTIKIIKIISKNILNDQYNFEENIKNYISSIYESKKINYWVNIYKKNIPLKKILLNTKKLLKETNISSRFVNKDFKNINTATIIWEKLVSKKTDLNFFINDENIYFWNTIWVQNIDEYSKRDFSKSRDMNIWMLPPKLAQIMINLWIKRDKIKDDNICIYDPFAWLWTVLIEALYIWIKNIYWSDLNPRMVEITNKNLDSFKKDFNFQKDIFLQNAKYISEVEILSNIDLIVSEWYLWEVMTKNNISIERIQKQKDKLLDLYEWFFSWLSRKWFKWNIVISFPFWENKWKYFYFEEIYDKINKYSYIQKLLPDYIDIKETKSGSLLYKRPNQLVGREIFSLKIK